MYYTYDIFRPAGGLAAPGPDAPPWRCGRPPAGTRGPFSLVLRCTSLCFSLFVFTSLLFEHILVFRVLADLPDVKYTVMLYCCIIMYSVMLYDIMLCYIMSCYIICHIIFDARRATRDAANARTKILDFGGFDSSIILNLRGGILRSIGHFLES